MLYILFYKSKNRNVQITYNDTNNLINAVSILSCNDLVLIARRYVTPAEYAVCPLQTDE
jgi:hypothetical protein